MLDMFTKKAPPRVAREVVVEAASNRELSWLAQRVEQGKAKPFAEIVTITPSIAARILENNSDNRRISERLVDEIVSDILAKRWELNGEPIILARDGGLNDGQHRLTAIIRSGVSVQALVMFGVTRESRYTVDMGRSRSVGDFLGMEGAKYSTESAAAARLYMAFRRGFFHAGGANAALFTRAAIRAEYWNNEKAFNAALAECVNQPFTLAVGKAPIIAAHVILHKASKDGAAFFFAKLMQGDDLKQGDAILALRNRLMASRDKRMRPFEKLEMILRHWNAWRLGKEIKQYKAQGSYPKVER